jgi:hypothetical protein
MGEAIAEFIGMLIVDFIWQKVFNFIGGSIRWFLGTIWRSIAQKPKYQFRDYINGIQDSGDWFDKSRRYWNSIIALIAIILVIYAVVLGL